MRKFLNTLSLCLAILAIGSWLNATPYPIGSLFPLVSDGTDVTMETGKFGIGTGNPQESLHVGAGTDASDISATDLLVTRAGPSNLSVRDSTNDVETFLFASTVGGIIGTITNDPLEIKTNNISAISIDTSQNVGIPTLTASEIVITDASKNLTSAAVATYPSLAEFIHVKGVTSALQTQIDGKQPLDSELTTIAALTETNSNVMFVAGGAWTSDATPAIDCTDCVNLPSGGTHPVNLASDVTGELPHASTSNDSSNVHGLDSGAFVLGNLDAAAEFVQRGTVNPAAGDSSAAVIYAITLTAVTFGTAFSAAPVVVTGGTVDVTKLATGAEAVTTTGFSISGFTNASSFNPTDLDWIALGT
ncbi:MAG TPA: hypothetical protein ENI05_07650 [Porticoccus sp.]|nr:hypothetical protein [Porticoccus sp.]